MSNNLRFSDVASSSKTITTRFFVTWKAIPVRFFARLMYLQLHLSPCIRHCIVTHLAVYNQHRLLRNLQRFSICDWIHSTLRSSVESADVISRLRWPRLDCAPNWKLGSKWAERNVTALKQTLACNGLLIEQQRHRVHQRWSGQRVYPRFYANCA